MKMASGAGWGRVCSKPELETQEYVYDPDPPTADAEIEPVPP
jgi:hypothetical protein